MLARRLARLVGVAMTLTASAVLMGAIWAGDVQLLDINWGASLGSVVLH